MDDGATPVKIARLMKTYDLDIESLPGSLNCAECKSVLKHVCQVPVDCRLCHTCVDDILASGIQFFPFAWRQCSEAHLSTAQRDRTTNRNHPILTAKCIKPDCLHECQLPDKEGHLQICPSKRVEYQFREIGCQRDTMAAVEMNSHLQEGSRSQNKTFIGMVANNNSDIEVLKQHHEASRAEIEMLKRNDEVSRGEIEMLKRELLLKDEQMKTIMDEIKHVQNEIKSTKDADKSIKREKEIDRMKLERDVGSRERDKLHSARIIAITGVMSSNRDALPIEMEPVRHEIRAVKEDKEATKDDVDSTKSQVQSTQKTIALEQVDTGSDAWLIDVDLGKVNWGWKWGNPKSSCTFERAAQPYKYQLASGNLVRSGELRIYLRVLGDPSEAQPEWPFRAAVTITVAHMDKSEACWRLTRNCLIEEPQNTQGAYSDPFVFWHSVLRTAGLDLDLGARVSCQIVLQESQ